MEVGGEAQELADQAGGDVVESNETERGTTAADAPESIQLHEPLETPAEAEQPAEEVVAAAAAEPVIEPAKPARRRGGDDRQTSLFGDDPRPGLPASAPDPATTRIAKPIPGRSFLPGVARIPVRRVEPPAEPQPEPKAEPEPVRIDPPRPEMTRTPVRRPEPPAEPQPEPEALEQPPEPVQEPEPVTAPATPVAPPPTVPARTAPSTAAPRTPPPRAPIPPASPAVPPGGKAAQQETLQFEPVSRGRFDKSEPTIVDGQDLDVPTFLRRNVRVR